MCINRKAFGVFWTLFQCKNRLWRGKSNFWSCFFSLYAANLIFPAGLVQFWPRYLKEWPYKSLYIDVHENTWSLMSSSWIGVESIDLFKSSCIGGFLEWSSKIRRIWFSEIHFSIYESQCIWKEKITNIYSFSYTVSGRKFGPLLSEAFKWLIKIQISNIAFENYSIELNGCFLTIIY